MPLPSFQRLSMLQRVLPQQRVVGRRRHLRPARMRSGGVASTGTRCTLLTTSAQSAEVNAPVEAIPHKVRVGGRHRTANGIHLICIPMCNRRNRRSTRIPFHTSRPRLPSTECLHTSRPRLPSTECLHTTQQSCLAARAQGVGRRWLHQVRCALVAGLRFTRQRAKSPP